MRKRVHRTGTKFASMHGLPVTQRCACLRAVVTCPSREHASAERRRCSNSVCRRTL